MDGENRALRAAEAAISNPLLDDVSMKGARAVLVNVTGGPDLMLFEVDEAVNRIRAEVDPDANILFGSALSETMEGRVRVSVVATGIDAEAMAKMTRGNVQPLWPQGRPRTVGDVPLAATGTDGRAGEASQSPVHKQVENLAQGFSRTDSQVMDSDLREVLPAMLRGTDAAAAGADLPAAAEEPLYARAEAPRAEPMRAYAPPEREKRRFGLFGSRRRETRVEPATEPREAPRQRPAATAQAIDPVQQPTPAMTGESRPEPKDDLFAGVPEDDRFEIPAFLRRQANSGN
jgi:cell division protein FtsZ